MEAEGKPKRQVSEENVLKLIIPAAFKTIEKRSDLRVIEINRKAWNVANFPPEEDRFHLRVAFWAQNR